MTDMLDETRLVGLAKTLVARPSQQTDRMEAEPEVQDFIRDCAAPLLRELGLTGGFDRMGNWIGRFGSGKGPSLLLVTYAMTHPAAAMSEAFVPRIVDDGGALALRGRGAAEQKGAMAAAFAAVAKAVAAGRMNGELTLAVSSAGETGRHDAIKVILAELDRRPDFAILALGTGSRVSLGNKGRIDFDVVVRGRSAHSSTPWLAVDAIAGARRVFDALDSLTLPDRNHPALGGATLTPTSIQSGPRATHTIQDLARVTFDRRLLPGESPDEALATVRAAIAGLAGPQTFALEQGPFMYPAEIAEDGPLVTLIRAAHERVGLVPPGTFYSHGALDAGYLIAQGIEATMWGPGAMELFHTEHERVSLAELTTVARGYQAVLTHAGRVSP
ncbi:MAG: M20/M25/M40 family metallo-hydrolase [Xanthobacteraceae bacterium]|nr:M20/M25/M40 family metallo-hydrolase [Xanthobacteraceae bacterium]PWB57487.1 MAG: hypothetical protein C3F17_20290 [Bradyrhizobiaceae bacterium]